MLKGSIISVIMVLLMVIISCTAEELTNTYLRKLDIIGDPSRSPTTFRPTFTPTPPPTMSPTEITDEGIVAATIGALFGAALVGGGVYTVFYSKK